VTVQFTIPRSVAAQLDTRAIIGRARNAGVEMPSLELNDKDAGPSKTRVTCREGIALLVIEALHVLAAAAEARHDIDVLTDCALGVTAMFDAIDAARGINRAAALKGFGRNS